MGVGGVWGSGVGVVGVRCNLGGCGFWMWWSGVVGVEVRW